jgi:carboxypeptidase Taq
VIAIVQPSLKTQPGGVEIKPLDELKARLLEVEDLKAAASLLRWDQMTYMPPGGGMTRGRQIGTLSRLAHEKFTDAAVGRLLDRLEKETAVPADSDEAALVRVTRRLYEQSVRVPTALVAEFEEHTAATYGAWTVARPANDFPAVRPLLEKTLELSRAWANCFPGYASIADPLIELNDYGMKASSVRNTFAALRARLVPLMRAIASRPRADVSCLRQYAPADQQLAFGVKVVAACGYDFERGRLDMTAHPFTTKFSLGDVRITTRVSETDVLDAVFTMLHECGHALYEQGIRRELDGTPLASSASFSVDESQARLWENLVGRSREFWEHFYPRLQQALPRQFEGVDIDTFYRAINCVEPSLVRGSADEVTYNLHVILRFDLELDLLEGRLAVADLPRVWRERFEADFGIPVPDDRDGVLQDVHWYAGRIGGAFQGYTLGNVMSAQLLAAALAAHPEIPGQMASGQFSTLHGWLRENLYQHGAKFTGSEALRRATGMDMTTGPYLDYLWGKYQSLYALEQRELMADSPASIRAAKPPVA